MLSTNLVWLRKHYQYTQEEIAQQVGVSRQSVAKWESGVSQIKGYQKITYVYLLAKDFIIREILQLKEVSFFTIKTVDNLVISL